MRPCYFSELQTLARRRKFWSRPPLPARPRKGNSDRIFVTKWKGAIAKSSRLALFGIGSYLVGVVSDTVLPGRRAASRRSSVVPGHPKRAVMPFSSKAREIHDHIVSSGKADYWIAAARSL